jgi:hypothetical protein
MACHHETAVHIIARSCVCVCAVLLLLLCCGWCVIAAPHERPQMCADFAELLLLLRCGFFCNYSTP